MAHLPPTDWQMIKDLPLKIVPGIDGFKTNFYLTI